MIYDMAMCVAGLGIGVFIYIVGYWYIKILPLRKVNEMDTSVKTITIRAAGSGGGVVKQESNIIRTNFKSDNSRKYSYDDDLLNPLSPISPINVFSDNYSTDNNTSNSSHQSVSSYHHDTYSHSHSHCNDNSSHSHHSSHDNNICSWD